MVPIYPFCSVAFILQVRHKKQTRDHMSSSFFNPNILFWSSTQPWELSATLSFQHQFLKHRQPRIFVPWRRRKKKDGSFPTRPLANTRTAQR